ncbi:MAG: tetratricopeptide repeat protein [Bacteroidia bacterium]
MTTIDRMFELAIELRDKGELRDSIKVFSKILTDYPNDKLKHRVHLVLAGVQFDLKEYDNALINFNNATEFDPTSELASLGLYITFVELDRCEEAISELIRYLKSYPAKLYKDTLEELLEGLEEGYMTDYEDDIRDFARVNGVEL